MKRKFLTFMAVAFAVAASAQEKPAHDYGDFTVDAQVRALGEFRGGLGNLSDGSSASKLFVNDRVRLSFGWERKNISMKISAQHAGSWQNSSQKNNLGKITLHEAWAKMVFGKGFFAQVGRQELCYDDERLFGAHDWAASGRAHDALRVGWGNDKHQIHAIASFNQTADVVDDITIGSAASNTRLYKNMQTLWYHFGKEQSPFQLSALFTNQGASDVKEDSLRYMQTFGVYMSYAKRTLSADFSAYYQTGRDRTGADLRAFMMSGNFGWRFAPKWNAVIGDDYLSGSDGMPGTNRTFNPLYGSYHKFFGSMDYFAYSAVPLYGLNDLHLRFAYNCNPKLDMSLAYHWLTTGRPINDYLNDDGPRLRDPELIKKMRKYNGKYRFTQSLGHELDLQINYRPWKFVAIQAGYSMMLTTETTQLIKGTELKKVQNWAWLCLDINPTIFSTKQRKKN